MVHSPARRLFESSPGDNEKEQTVCHLLLYPAQIIRGIPIRILLLFYGPAWDQSVLIRLYSARG